MANTLLYQPRVSALGAQVFDISGTPPGGLAVTALDGSAAFTGAAAFEGSVDGEKWEAITAVTHDMTTVQVSELFKFVRVNCTSYTSGELVVKFAAYTPQ